MHAPIAKAELGFCLINLKFDVNCHFKHELWLILKLTSIFLPTKNFLSSFMTSKRLMFARAPKKNFMVSSGSRATMCFISNFVGLGGLSSLRLFNSSLFIPSLEPKSTQAFSSRSRRVVSFSTASKSSSKVWIVLLKSAAEAKTKIKLYVVNQACGSTRILS